VSGPDRTLLRPVLLVWLLAAAVTTAPYVRAELSPPPGTRFLGFFFFVDDAYNYLSYVQQAEDGAFVFVNKLAAERHAPALVNLEWWSVGALSGLLGRHPAAAYRIFGAAAGLGLLWMAGRWLRALGLPDTHLLPALALIAFGGGLGGARYRLLGAPPVDCPDLATGLFPFIEMLANPHFVAGTALFLAALLSFMNARRGRDHARSAVLGTALGLVRPYDLALLVAARAGGVFFSSPPSAWLRALLPLASLLPVVLYDAWVFYGVPAFAFLGRAPYVSPGPGAMASALLPALALALPAATRRGAGIASGARAHFAAWACLALAVLALRPVHFSLQFAVGLGLPLLAFGALSLSRFRPAVTLAAAALLSSTAVAALFLVLSPNPRWHVPKARLDIALALRGHCAPGQVLLSPPDIGLYAAGLTACKAYVSHAVVPDFAERDATVRSFYASWSPEQRRSFLDRAGVDLVALPGIAAEAPERWLVPLPPFTRVAQAGEGAAAICVYGRSALLRRPEAP